MRPFLYFILGFTIVFSSCICCYSAALPYPGECNVILYKQSGSTYPNGYGSWYISNPSTGSITYGLPIQYGVQSQYYEVVNYFKNHPDSECSGSNCWAIAGSINSRAYVAPGPGTEVSSSLSLITPSQLYGAGYLTCSKECPDSDSDGLCDACDQDPNDSTVGGDLYLKGWYEYNGEMVASLTSYSASNDSYDHVRINKNYSGNITEVPGYVLGLGMPTHINGQELVKGGGKFIGMVTPEKIRTTACAPVTDLSQCNADVCQHTIYNDNANEKSPENVETVTPTLQQKQDDADYLYPDKTCEQYRSLAERSCGGTAGVKNFACNEGSSGKHVSVECLNDGYYEMAPDWDSLGQQFEGDDLNPDADDIEGTGTATGSRNIGSSTTAGGGDTGPGGEGTDSDSDGDIDGYQMGDRSLDYGPLLNATSNIAGRFPFSIVATLKNMGDSFTAQGQCPSFSFPVWNQTVNFDLCAFNAIASLIRNLFSFLLTAACFWGLIKFFM